METWFEFVTRLLNTNPDFIDKQNVYFYNTKNVTLSEIENPFELCFYTNPKGKMKTLRKQYINQDSLIQLKGDLSNGALNELTLSLVGEAKKGSNANYKHCLQSLTINREKKEVQINLRSSDLFKKFPIDYYFINEVLKENGIFSYKTVWNFDKIILRGPFFYIYLEELYKRTNEETLNKMMSSKNYMVDVFINYYKTNLHKNLKYKSLERCRRYMLKTELWFKIKHHIEGEPNVL